MPFQLDTLPTVNVKHTIFGAAEIQNANNNSYRLLYQGKQWMTANFAHNIQFKELYSSYDLAYGDVVLSGLGLGLLPLWVANKPNVTSVTVYEKNSDVIELFKLNNPQIQNLTIINQDITEVVSSNRFDCLLLDHFEFESVQVKEAEVKRITLNLPNHKVLWWWSLENSFTEHIPAEKIYGTYLRNNSISFFTDYEKLKLSFPTLPALTSTKLNEYVYTYFDKLGYVVN